MKVGLVACRHVAALSLWLLSCPVMGQDAARRSVIKEEYHLWGQLLQGAISDKGNWASFRMRYDSGADTLFVRNTRTEKSFLFANGQDGMFSGDGFFACSVNGCLHLADLWKGKTVKIDSVKRYEWTADGRLFNQVKDKLAFVKWLGDYAPRATSP